MVYIETIKINNHTYPGSAVLSKEFIIKCSNINLLVGDQGCGKSTLLQMLQKNHQDLALTFNKELDIKINPINSFYFDCERDNPRIKDPVLFTKPSGEDVGIGFIGATMSRFKSHGEILKEIVVTPLKKAKDCIILLDEPESGLSLNNQFLFINEVRKAIKRNCQFFIATHCYPLIKEFDVISLEHNEQMKGIDFINKLNF